MTAADYPTAPLYSCPGKPPLIRYKYTGEYGPVALGELRRALRGYGYNDRLVDRHGRVLAPHEIVRLHGVRITAAEYARLEAYRQRFSTRPPAGQSGAA